MVDNVNPTSQFHPYQPQDVLRWPNGRSRAVSAGILSGLGIDQGKITRVWPLDEEFRSFESAGHAAATAAQSARRPGRSRSSALA